MCKFSPDFTYIETPEEIYKASFQRIKEQADLSLFPKDLETVVTRMIHSCGLIEITKQIAYDEAFCTKAEQALRNEAPIIVDSHMLKAAIVQKECLQSRLVCTLGFPSVHALAKQRKMTRSAVSVEYWDRSIEGAIVVIGNAPTALFHLLTCIKNEKLPKPAAIIATPVGFVGAEESKEALIAHPPAPFLTLRGRAGGSAIAAGAINALILKHLAHETCET